MKGAVFTAFNDMVDETFSPDVWEWLVDETAPGSGAIYTSAGSYPASELMNYVAALAERTGAAPNALVRTFGTYLLHVFYQRHRVFFVDVGVRDFLQSVHNVIHVEVQKLHPDANLPWFEYETPSPDQLVMIYDSPRRMCALVEGLLDGVAQVFGTELQTTHATCTHRGAAHCRFEVAFTDPDKRVEYSE
ncbi:MAG: heme NO-binding domain-containing protein [Pseudomonadota bacterium]